MERDKFAEMCVDLVVPCKKCDGYLTTNDKHFTDPVLAADYQYQVLRKTQSTPIGESVCEDRVRFLIWWNQEGSCPPQKGYDFEEHAKNLTWVAWQNGKF